MTVLAEVVKRWLSDVRLFSKIVVRRELRSYQVEVARAIVDSVIHQRGLTFAIMFPRQSGKNETQAQIEAYLLNLFQRVPGAQIVKASPTYKPQTINSLIRIGAVLDNDWNRGRWKREQMYMVRLGQARALFFSGEPSAKVVGATASLLLECAEAQDVTIEKWDKDFAPMAAASNATTVFWGTAWTDRTLLAREIRRLRELERGDGVQRVFVITPDDVARENPAYGKYVAAQVARLGRNHPLVRTQYFLEEIGGEGGLFPAVRRALMRGEHLRARVPAPGASYAVLVDVAGEEEGQLAGAALSPADPGGKRDSTALTVVAIDTATVSDPLLRAPTYRVVERVLMTGAKHATQYAACRSLVKFWNARQIVVDATGMGAPLASFLAREFGERVIPFEFTSASKSDLGWDFLGLCDSGRFKDHADDSPEKERFFRELEACEYEIALGAGRVMKWGVPLKRDPVSGDYLHDDLLMSAARTAVLDRQAWAIEGKTLVVPGKDPLSEIDQGGW